MAIQIGPTFGDQLVEALGLKGRPIRSLVISVQPDEVVTVYIEEFLDERHAKPLLERIAENCDEIRIEASGEQPRLKYGPSFLPRKIRPEKAVATKPLPIPPLSIWAWIKRLFTG